MPETESSNPKGGLLVGGAILVFWGLLFLLVAINSIVNREGSIGDRVLFATLGAVPLLIGALLIKEAVSNDDPETLMSSHPGPTKILKKAQNDGGRKRAADRVNEQFKTPTTLTNSDTALLEQVKHDILNAPSHDEVIIKLNRLGADSSVPGNPKIQPVAFALRSASTSQYLKGIAMSFMLWCGFVIFMPLLMVISSLVLRWFTEMERRTRRHLIRPHKQLAKETRAPILYLRSFLEEQENDYNSEFLETKEEQQFANYSRSGPVLALGQPNEVLPLLGATRLYFVNDTWQLGVLYLMSIAQVVVLEAGTAQWLLWELGIARKRLEPQRLIISFAGWSDLNQSRHDERYSRFKKFAEALLECKLPPTIHHDECIAFGNDWAPTVRTSEKQGKAVDDDGYNWIGALGSIIFVIVGVCTIRLGVGWFNYEDQFQKFFNKCIAYESANPMRIIDADPETLLRKVEGEDVPSRDFVAYCTCLSDHAKQNVSRFDVAITVGSLELVDRFDEAKLLSEARRRNGKMCNR